MLAYHAGLMASDEVHAGPVGQVILPVPGQGLPLFLVLSGFLLFRPFASSLLRGSELPSFRRYARNRVLRIYPAYLLIFCVASLGMGCVYLLGSTHGFGPENVGRLTDPAKFVANALLLHMFIPQFVMSGLPVAWSLTAEITFQRGRPRHGVARRWAHQAGDAQGDGTGGPGGRTDCRRPGRFLLGSPCS